MHLIRITCLSVLSLLLVFSFALHSIDTTHVHYGSDHSHQHGEVSSAADTETPTLSIGEYFHGIEQKFFLAVVLSIIGLAIFWLQPFSTATTPLLRLLWAQRLAISPLLRLMRKYDYFSILFASGLLHPKLH